MEARYSLDDACARNQAMLIYLIVTSLILMGGKQCTLFSRICTILIGNYAIVPIILSSSKCQFYRRWTSGKCLTWLVNFLAGAAGQWKRNESRGEFINHWKLCDCDLFICLFRWHTHLKDMNSLWWNICYGRAIQAVVGASDAVPCQYLDVMESIHATVG